jgi:crossover junction endodeoxyribonuclease RusA
MLPFEFIVIGTPVSHQSHNKALLRQWQLSVRQAAEFSWLSGAPAVATDCLLIGVYYFGAHPALLDNDNFIKPIQDALIGLVYLDDSQVTDNFIRRTDIRGAFYIPDETALVARAIRQGDEFVYVRVENAPDHRRLL